MSSPVDQRHIDRNIRIPDRLASSYEKIHGRKFLVPGNYYGKLRRLLIDPHHCNEGDIHVWPDDHFEWDEVGRAAREQGFEPLFAEDYLVCRAGYRPEMYEAYRDRCSDMRVTALRKGG